jgi:hypothetical protein
MNKLINESVNDIIGKVVKECSKHYDFDFEEAMIRLGLKEESDVNKVLKEKKEEKKEKNKKIPLPYNGEEDKNSCCGLIQNHGLYTQCEKKKKENDLCETCNKQALKNDSGKPDYGRIEDRKQVGWMEFRDPKGKKPISYLKLMTKLGITKEEVWKEAEKRNKKIDEIHFEEEEEEEEKKKGRPKKSKKVLEVEGETNDLFAELIASVNTKENKVVVIEPLEEEEKKLPATPRLSEAIVSEAIVSEAIVSEAKKEKKEKVVKEKVVKEKVVKEKVVKEKVVKEKVVKEKVVKKDKKEKKEKVISEAKKEESQSQEEEKESQSQEEEKESQSQEEEKESQSQEEEKESEEEADVVKRFEYEGIKYLKSKKTGIIYNMEQELVGKWNEDTKKIDFAEQDEEEEEEEEYDE